MDNPSFAELKERFSKPNPLPYPKPRGGSIDNELPSDPTKSEKRKNGTSNESSDNPLWKVSDRTAAPSQISNGASFSRDAILLRHQQSKVNGTTSFKKAPVPLPRPIVSRRNKNASSESLSASPNPPLEQISPPKTYINMTATQSPVVSLPTAHPDENTYIELSDDLPNGPLSSHVPETETYYEYLDQPSISFPNPIPVDQGNNSRPELSSVSLEAMLPSKCMFSELERTIDEYQRRDPRTIIYPEIKPTMSKITSNEMNTLQRYSKT